MTQKTFDTHPSNAINKIAELREDGWTIIATGDTSTPQTSEDAHGVSYGGPNFSILAEREYVKPEYLSRSQFNNSLMKSMPCNPPRPGGR